MNYLNYIKENFTRVPYPVGRIVSLVPYNIRPGISSIYRKRKKEIKQLSTFDELEHKNFIFKKTKNIAVYAFQNIPFYRELYQNHEVNPEKFTCFEDLSYLPIITKKDLQEVPLEFRSNLNLSRNLANTGGSSGQPLSFYIQPSSIPHEWAHMHAIWDKLGYTQKDLKIVFGGRADVKNTIEYDAVRHQLTIDIYKSPEIIANNLHCLFKKYRPRYIHGYPSSIFDFIIWLDVNKHPLLNTLQKNIKGIFLGSEFPSPQLRDRVEKLLQCSSVSWYGHTERAVLAYEKIAKYKYSPFTSYGFSEAIQFNNTQQFELVGTSYYNQVSPLIRYNTNDLIKPTFDKGLLIDFTISQGRNGEFIIDKNGNKIYLTALIFGRHHAIFNYVQHIQIKQDSYGSAIFFITTNSEYSPYFLLSKMDLSNIDLDYKIEILSEPIKTPSGKVPLLIKS